MANPKIFDQIEQAADTYAPQVYAKLLSSGDFTAEQDSTETYIPVTAASPNVIKFIVGLLPPAPEVTGRLLDRSASIRDITGMPVDVRTGVSLPPIGSPPIQTGGKSSLPDDFWVKFVAMCQRLRVDPLALGNLIQIESGFTTGAIAVDVNGKAQTKEVPGALVAKGLNQMIKYTATSLGMTDAEWANLQNESADRQLYWVEKCYQKNSIAGLSPGQVYAAHLGGFQNNGNPPGDIAWASEEFQASYIAAHPDFVFPQPGQQRASYRALSASGFDKNGDGFITGAEIASKATGVPSDVAAKISEATAALAAGADGSLQEGDHPDGGPTTSWHTEGSQNAQQAASEDGKLAGTGFNRSTLGRQFLAAQLATIKATLQELDKIRNTPPLKLLVNPTSFKVSSDKILSDGNWVRNGPVLEHWGNGQDKIDGSGKVAGFYAIDTAHGATPGLSRTARFYSASYQNLLSLWLLYKNNGALYLDLAKITNNLNETTRLSVVGSIYIYYDGILYFGSFDNFNLTESDSGPFTLEYTFQFTVRSAFLLDRPLNPLNFGYGNTTAIAGDPSTTKQYLEDSILALPGSPVAPPPPNTGGDKTESLKAEFLTTTGLGTLPTTTPTPSGQPVKPPPK